MPRTSLMMRVAARPREGHVVVEEVRRHAVDRSHGAQGADKFIGAPVAHDAHGLHRQQHGKGLPDLVVKACLADLVEIDGVGLSQDIEFVAGDRRPAGGWRAPVPGRGDGRRNLSGRPSSRPSARTSSLNNSRRGSTSFMFMRSGRPADIVVGLDRHRRAAGESSPTFDDVRIKRALRQDSQRRRAFWLALQRFR